MAAAQAPTENVGKTRCLVFCCMKVCAEALTLSLSIISYAGEQGLEPGELDTFINRSSSDSYRVTSADSPSFLSLIEVAASDFSSELQRKAGLHSATMP